MGGAEPRGGGQANEKASPERLACLVDYYDILSNFLEDVMKLGKFAESVQMI